MFGERYLPKAKGKTHKIEKAYIMEQYTEAGNPFDVALLELQEPITDDDAIRPVCVDFQGKFGTSA